MFSEGGRYRDNKKNGGAPQLRDQLEQFGERKVKKNVVCGVQKQQIAVIQIGAEEVEERKTIGAAMLYALREQKKLQTLLRNNRNQNEGRRIAAFQMALHMQRRQRKGLDDNVCQ